MTDRSEAARKGWAKRPAGVRNPRGAGRPTSSRPRKAVTLRLDAAAWDTLRAAAKVGRVPSAEQAMNAALLQLVAQLSDVA